MDYNYDDDEVDDGTDDNDAMTKNEGDNVVIGYALIIIIITMRIKVMMTTMTIIVVVLLVVLVIWC